MDVNAIMLENRKKRKGTSSITPNKVITKVSLPQEGDICETIGEITINDDNPTTTSSFVRKAIEIAIEEGHNLRDVDTK
jgi:hypothetical protein